MTKTLTEQLKNGTLKDGLYYIKDNDNILIGLRNSLTMIRLIDDGCPSFEVLSPMPSYNEYKAILSDQLAKIEGEEIIEELKAEMNELLKKIEGLKLENKKLKDRLDNAHRTLCEVLRMSLSDEKDISKIYDIVKPTIEKLNQLLI